MGTKEPTAVSPTGKRREVPGNRGSYPIKFSNDEFTDRFEREAKSVAALNSPYSRPSLVILGDHLKTGHR